MTKMAENIYKLVDNAAARSFLEECGAVKSPDAELAESMRRLADAQERLARARDEAHSR